MVLCPANTPGCVLVTLVSEAAVGSFAASSRVPVPAAECDSLCNSHLPVGLLGPRGSDGALHSGRLLFVGLRLHVDLLGPGVRLHAQQTAEAIVTSLEETGLGEVVHFRVRELRFSGSAFMAFFAKTSS